MAKFSVGFITSSLANIKGIDDVVSLAIGSLSLPNSKPSPVPLYLPLAKTVIPPLDTCMNAVGMLICWPFLIVADTPLIALERDLLLRREEAIPLALNDVVPVDRSCLAWNAVSDKGNPEAIIDAVRFLRFELRTFNSLLIRDAEIL